MMMLSRITFSSLLLCSLAKAQGECWQPDPVPNAYRSFIGFPHLEGTRIVYKCFDNYIHTFGDLERLCTSGVYTGVNPSCEIQCGVPKSYHDSTVSYGSGLLVGSVATYACNSDSSITTTAVCQEDGRWLYNDEFPCSVTNLLLGQTVYTHNDGTSNDATDGDILTYFEFQTQLEPSLAVFFEQPDKFFDVFRYVIRFPNTVDSELDRVQMCFESDSTLSATNICADTEIIGNPVDLIVNETIPCCFYANWIILQGFMKVNPGILSIHEVELYGRPRTINCGLPKLVYGADVTTDTTGLVHVGEYSCMDGFYQTSPFLDISCYPHNNWLSRDILPKCRDDPIVEINSTNGWGLTGLQDNDVATCRSVYANFDIPFHFNNISEIKEVIVTIGSWENVEDVKIKTNYSGQEKSCTTLYDSGDVGKSQSFLCNYNLATSIIFRYDNSSAFMVDMCEIKVVGFEWSEGHSLECYRTDDATDYKGKMNFTVSGSACDPWTGADLLQHENYCRSFNKSRPWCFIGGYSDWEFCPVVKCETICSEREDGFDYVGNLDITINGQQCRSWDIKDVYDRRFSELAFPYHNRSQAYCRNPGKSQDTTWCYTALNKFDRCTVPTCPTEFYHLELCNCSANNPLHLQYMHLWDLRTGDKIEKYNQTVDDTTVQYYCANLFFSDIFAFTLLHSPNWIRISFVCKMEEEMPSLISLTPCQSSTVDLQPSTSYSDTQLTSTYSVLEHSSYYSDYEHTSYSDLQQSSPNYDLQTSSSYSELQQSSSYSELQQSSSYSELQQSSSYSELQQSSSYSELQQSSSSDSELQPSSSYSELQQSSSYSELQQSSSYSELSELQQSSSSYSELQQSSSSYSELQQSSSSYSDIQQSSSYSELLQSSFDIQPPSTSLSETFTTSSETSSLISTAYPPTTPIPTTSVGFVNTNNSCLCRCFRNNIFNMSNTALQEQIENLTKGLYISTDVLSSTIRRLNSADDPRPSATYVGSTAIFIFTMTFVLVIIPDIINLFQFLKRCASNEEDEKNAA